MTVILTVPGLGGSGATHWQSHWERTHAHCRRVSMPNWNIPDRTEWVGALDHSVRACESAPILAAHSLGCVAAAHWALRHADTPVKGMLMVAPADVDNRDTIPAEALCFAPMPLGVMPFPTIVVASTTDPYVTIERAQIFATAWGADFVNVGAHGHINADSHLGDWDEGWALIQDLKAVTPGMCWGKN